MHKSRLEAFSDGVIAIIITIMVLEMKAPHGAGWGEMWESVGPKFVSYVISFLYVGIYWNNHHHLFQAVHQVNGAVLWANLHLLFWLSLLPFCAAWMGENHFAAAPMGLYGFILLGAALAYFILTKALLRIHSLDSHLAKALKRTGKEKFSILLYVAAIAASWLHGWISLALYLVVALLWMVPDRRIEKMLEV